MFNDSKRGFTITEVIIFTSAIAVIAALLIPLFASYDNRLNVAPYVQVARDLNVILDDNQQLESIEDVDSLFVDAGYNMGYLNTRSDDCRLVWEKTSNQIIVIDQYFNVISNYREYDENEWELWLPVCATADVLKSSKMNFNYYLACDSEDNMDVLTLSNFVTGKNTLKGNLVVDTLEHGTITLDGNFEGNVSIRTPNACIQQYGVIINTTIYLVSDEYFNVNGYIENLSIRGGKLYNKNASYIKNLSFDGTEVIVENDGIISNIVNTDSLPVNSRFNNTYGYVENTPQVGGIYNPGKDVFVYEINNLRQLESFRNAINYGAVFDGLTVKLMEDITLKDGWVPIGAFRRDSRSYRGELVGFSGIFDGNGHTIDNLNNKGYEPELISLFANSSTPAYNEYVYGLFGVVSDATISDLTLTNVNIDIENSYIVGDSVGAFVGYATGALTMERCIATGYIKANDAVGGIVGRLYLREEKTEQGVYYGSRVVFKNCRSRINITADRRCGGIVGYIANFPSTGSIRFANCFNYSNINSLGDVDSYASGIATIEEGVTTELSNCHNQGNVSAMDANGLVAINTNLTLKNRTGSIGTITSRSAETEEETEGE